MTFNDFRDFFYFFDYRFVLMGIVKDYSNKGTNLKTEGTGFDNET